MTGKIEITEAELQQKIQDAVDSATQGLKDKNAELLAEKKKLQKAAGVTPEQLAAVEAERDEALSKLDKATKDLTKAQKDLDASSKALESESGFTKSLLIDQGLTAELTKNNITNPALLKAAQALHRANVQIVVDGDKRIAKVGDKALADHIKEWAGTDEGKNFVAAPNSGGGGAPGGGGGGGTGKTITRAEFDALGPAEKMASHKAGVTVV